MNILFFLRPKSGVTYLTLGNSLRQGLEKMKNSGYTEVPVVAKDGTYIGTVSQGDFLWKILDKDFTDMQMAEHTSIDSLVSKRNVAVSINTTMEDLLSKAVEQNFVPVVDDFGAFVGIVTRKAIIKYFADKKA
ncbi:MAG: CBS domain-containing protein [Clostridia bacterium]|nr:CBS domain-containing protein [Clostridia bacterium]